jgi:hypothetical protein
LAYHPAGARKTSAASANALARLAAGTMKTTHVATAAYHAR